MSAADDELRQALERALGKQFDDAVASRTIVLQASNLLLRERLLQAQAELADARAQAAIAAAKR